MKLQNTLAPLLVIALVAMIVASAVRRPAGAKTPSSDATLAKLDRTATAEVDDWLENSWRQAELSPPETADDLTVLRRLSLALHGMVPSLEEIRQFQADDQPHKLERWTARMLDDPRFADYFAERLSKVFVGSEEGQLIIFRRDRLVDWLSEEIREDRPYDNTVRYLIGGKGLWTGQPEVNFLTAARVDEDFDENKLAGRTVRAFLGQRIDCAQCHDHPFGEWTQAQFEGLAAHFGQVGLTPFGVEDKPQDYVVQDRETLEDRTVAPSVPFSPQWLPQTGSRREQLAAWVTHPENRRFRRATVNRVWGLLFGRAWSQPVDDLADPPPLDSPDLLDILGDDFAAHDYSLKYLAATITATKAFRAASTYAGDPDKLAAAEANWAVFPLVRLRPEQMIGSLLQAASVQTIDRNAHWTIRAIRLIREGDFLREYGDLGDEELSERGGTIPQRLVLMNGSLVRELMEQNIFSSVGRVAAMAPTDRACVETAYLICLTRLPSEEEAEHFLGQLEGTKDKRRGRVVEDIYWTLLNVTEFSWNH